MDLGHKYTPFYCEENIWQLAQERVNGSAVFISNATRQVACFSQKRAHQPDEPMVWDYHVVWLEEGASGATATATATVWDFDSTLGLVTPAQVYLAETFRPVRAAFAPMFRLVAKADFVRDFASDRSHMKCADGSYQAAPPPWPCIGESEKPPNLAEFLRMDVSADAPGDVLSLDALLARTV
jgi:protein N-terminal glutamine amidohydrolase